MFCRDFTHHGTAVSVRSHRKQKPVVIIWSAKRKMLLVCSLELIGKCHPVFGGMAAW